MLTHTLRPDNILEVVETRRSAWGTERRWWYYDIKNWRCSSFGKKDDPIDRDMTNAAIEWVKDNYLSRAKA